MAYEAVKPPKEVKGDLVGEKGVHSRDDGDPDRPGDEDETFAIDVCNTAPEQEEAAKGEGVG